jgi:flagellar biosynthesis protein FlhB
MSEGADKDQKTEQATEHHKADLRKEGKVAQSHDVVSTAALLAACVAVAMTTKTLALAIAGLALRCLRLVDAHSPLTALQAATSALYGLLPILCVASFAAIAAGLAQTKGLFSIELAMPKLERLDPTSRFMQLLPSKEMATELAKSLLKIGAVGVVLYQIVDDSLPMLMAIGTEETLAAAVTVGGIATRLLMWAGAAFAVIAALDYSVALFKYNEEAKQTKQEQKEEHKQEEGNPQVKRKMRQRARELLAQAKAGDLKTATVIVTNPTHYAVALRYDPEKDAVPMIVAKALDQGALRMRTKARGYRIPIMENRPLARALHKHGKVGRPIPAEMYRAVAEIIAHVLRLRAGARS